MAHPDYYQTLGVSSAATPAEIKQAYRRLAKRFHPDSNQDSASHEKIAAVNAAYEVLGDPVNRQSYDQERQYRSRMAASGFSVDVVGDRQERTAAAQARYRKQQQSSKDADAQLERWLNRVYMPVMRLVHQIIQPLKVQLNELSADPFDDDLMADFQDYLEDCSDRLQQAQKLFRSVPNPPSAAGVAAHLYYCLNQVSDGLEQLEYFTNNYDDHCLHTGQELFRIAAGLRREAQASVKTLK